VRRPIFQLTMTIALGQIRSLVNEDVPRGVVLADAAYGNDNDFREGLVLLRLSYAVGIQSSTTLWPPGMVPLAPPKGKMGRHGCCEEMNNSSHSPRKTSPCV